MLNIHLELYSVLREKLPPESKGRAVLQVNEGTTLTDLLNKLGIGRKVVISVNGIQETDTSYMLCDGDTVKMFSSVSGG